MRIGADPEFTILDPKGNPVPAHLLGFGDKQHKTSVLSGYGGETFFRDGTNVEVNPYPATCRGQLTRSLRICVKAAAETLPKGYTLTAVPSYKLPKFKTTMKDAPPDVKMFGCDPWWNAYTGQQERSEVDAATHLYRYAGGHIHFGSIMTGYPAIADRANHLLAVKLLDLYVGVPSVVLFDSADEFKRRKVYGKAGEFRPQVYPNKEVGLEYRTPSPRIFNHPALVTLFTGVGRYILENFRDFAKRYDTGLAEAVQRAVNTGVGAVGLLQTVKGFYTPATILDLKQVPEIYRFQLGTFTHDPEQQGWTETARDVWKLAVPSVY